MTVAVAIARNYRAAIAVVSSRLLWIVLDFRTTVCSRRDESPSLWIQGFPDAKRHVYELTSPNGTARHRIRYRKEYSNR